MNQAINKQKQDDCYVTSQDKVWTSLIIMLKEDSSQIHKSVLLCA